MKDGSVKNPRGLLNPTKLPTPGMARPNLLKIETSFGISSTGLVFDGPKYEEKEISKNSESSELKKQRPPVCPRVTMEVGQAHNLLQSIHFDFSRKKIKITDDIKAPKAPYELTGQDKSSETDTLFDSENPRATFTTLPSELQKVLQDHFAEKLTSANQDAASIVLDEVIPAYDVNNEDTINDDFFTQCKTLVDQQKYDKLSLLAGAPPENADQDQAKMWWIYAQEKLGDFSIVLLAAPLKELIYKIVNDEQHILRSATYFTYLAHSTSRIIALLVKQEGGHLDGYSLIKGLEAIDSESIDITAERSAIYEYLKEKDRFELTTTERSVYEELKSSTNDLSDKAQEQSSNISLSCLNSRQQAVMAKSRRQYIGRSISLLLLIGVLSCYFIFFQFSKSLVNSKTGEKSLTVLPGDLPKLILPLNTQAVAGVLDGLLVDAELSAKLPDGKLANNDNKGESVAATVLTSVPKLGNSINTSGPIEPPELKQALRQGDKKPASSGLHARDYGKDFVRNLGRNIGLAGSVESGQGEYRPIENQGAEDMPKEDRLDSLDNRIKPELFMVITDTEILAEPRFNAQVLERVRQGSRVRVLDRVGNWLRLSSSDGRFGYIIVHDAVRDSSRRS